jgi:DNA-binding MarR family transcriptional regulator
VRKEQFRGGCEARVDAVRHFNRFFTRRIGVLHEGLLHSPFSLTEVRILYEIAHRERTLTASDLSRELDLDPGYLSRMLTRLKQQGLIDKLRSETDARRRLLSLTRKGKEIFSVLDARSREEVAEMLGGLSKGDQLRLLEAMRTIEGVVGEDSAGRFKSSEPFVMRQHEPGDIGWVVHRHGVLYAKEYGWDERFEALVARIVADFVDGYDPTKERCWIAEMSRSAYASPEAAATRSSRSGPIACSAPPGASTRSTGSSSWRKKSTTALVRTSSDRTGN